MSSGPQLQTNYPRTARQLACLLSGALGYRVEFIRWREIERPYGPSGIRLAFTHKPLVVSDDTQMTVFTLEGMARAAATSSIVDEMLHRLGRWLLV